MPARILIADDNARVRTALRQLLEAPHHEFIEASDGQEALSKALESRPEIVILDLAMPVMDGLTAARKILKALPRTPIFLCTMHWSHHLDVEARALGVRKVVSKAQSSILIEAIQQLLHAGEPHAAEDPQLSPAPPLPPNPTLRPVPIDPPVATEPAEARSANTGPNLLGLPRSG